VRQATIVYVCLAILVVYFLLQFLSASTRTLLALTGVPLAMLLATFVVGYVKLRKSRLRFLYLALPVLVITVSVYLLLPDLRRIQWRRQLEKTGARVTLQFDQDYTYLPRWLKEELDWAFLGRIKQIDFGGKPVPVTELSTLSFTESIWFLNLEGSEVSRDDLDRLAGLFDAEVVSLSRTPADQSSLEATI
jgi:hypothetical protein